MSEFLSFRKMLTPMLIQAIFWIGVAAVAITGLMMIFSGDAGGAVTGILTILVGPVIWRVYCEVIIVMFRILDVLIEIRDQRAGPA